MVVIKSTDDGQAIYINGFPMGGSGTVGNYTMYVNPYLVVANMKYTKHFYIEGQRIVSKLGEMGELRSLRSNRQHHKKQIPCWQYQYLLNPKDTLAGGGTIDFDLKGKELKEAIYANFESLGLDGAVFTAGKSGKVPYGRLKKYYRNQDLVNAGGENTTQPDYTDEPSNKIENLQFYYHPDHLGSSSYITDISGEVYQHMEYFPFGETFIEERTDAEYTSYLYNGKELDEETGLYYYGARYYDAKISMWYGVDPLVDKNVGSSPYNYCVNNPLKYIDPNGQDTLLMNNKSGETLDIKKGGNDYVFWTNDEELKENSWGNSQQLFHALNISGKSGGTTSKKGDPVVWSRLQDKTGDFNKLLSEGMKAWIKHKNGFENYEGWTVPGNKFIEKSRFFAAAVDDNAPYDIKNGKYHPKYIGEWSVYEGKIVRYDDYGNILYGAIGAAFGFSNSYLQFGANINQLGKTGLDDGKDTYSIEVGINKFKK